MTDTHAVVWLDHRDARIITFSRDHRETVEVHSDTEERRIHRKGGVVGSGHLADDHAFFDDVVAQVGNIREVLITGPGTAKTAFSTYVRSHHPDLARRIGGVKTLKRVTDGELEAFGRRAFRAIDQLGLI